MLKPTQAVLVRTAEKKAELSKVFKWPEDYGNGSGSCVMTILEAKGREFTDILMYDCLTCTVWQLVAQ